MLQPVRAASSPRVRNWSRMVVMLGILSDPLSCNFYRPPIIRGRGARRQKMTSLRSSLAPVATTESIYCRRALGEARAAIGGHVGQTVTRVIPDSFSSYRPRQTRDASMNETSVSDYVRAFVAAMVLAFCCAAPVA